MSPFNVITTKIVERYGHPARTAYLYLFWLKPDSDRAPLVPAAGDVLTAWYDEGNGLKIAEPETAVARCQKASEFRGIRPKNTEERRLQMSRVVTITLVQQTETQILVDLFSRSLVFSPKGDRQALEYWHPAEGSWYSAPVGRE